MSDFHYDVEKTNHYYIDDITIYGKSVQDGTPTPSAPVPIKAVEAPNLLDISASPTRNYATVDISDGSVTVTATSEIGWSYAGWYIPVSEVGSYTLSCDMTGSTARLSKYNGDTSQGYSDVTDGKATVTTDADTTRLRVLLYSRYAGSGAVGDTSTFSDIMLEKGSTATPYVPYGCIGLNCGGIQTPIDLNGNFLASLPDGTRDVLTIDSAGHVTVTKRVGYIASYNGESVGSVYLSTTGELTTGASVYYKLTTAQTIELNPIVLPSNSDEPYTISVTATLTPETAINQTNKPTYEVENPYEHIPGAEMEITPVHPMMQEWETFDPDNWDEQNMMGYTYQNEWHAVYTVYLGELMQSGVFDWSRPELDWSDAAIDEEQYKRVCDYFNLRFKWREISMLPVLKWFDYLHNKLVYELMPKYKPLYERVAEGVNPLSDNSEYRKSRSIDSAYPETLLSQNADYITQGNDFEEQKIHEAGTADAIVNFADVYKGVDQLLLDELEVMFVSLYTTNINGL